MSKFGYKLGVLAVSASLLAFAGCNTTTGGNTWSIEGVDGPTLTYTNNIATVAATIENVTIDVGATIAIPEMPHSTFEVAPNVQGGLLIQITLDPADVVALAGGNSLPPGDLPGGRPLPGISGGTMPQEAAQIPALGNTVFYIGSNVWGVFVPVGHFDTDQVMGTFSYYDKTNNLAGEISVVGNDSTGQNSGFLLMIDIPKAAASMQKAGQLDLNKLLK